MTGGSGIRPERMNLRDDVDQSVPFRADETSAVQSITRRTFFKLDLPPVRMISPVGSTAFRDRGTICFDTTST
jgi:hypothetical protein